VLEPEEVSLPIAAAEAVLVVVVVQGDKFQSEVAQPYRVVTNIGSWRWDPLAAHRLPAECHPQGKN
jgi:hypothetical protein